MSSMYSYISRKKKIVITCLTPGYRPKPDPDANPIIIIIIEGLRIVTLVTQIQYTVLNLP